MNNCSILAAALLTLSPAGLPAQQQAVDSNAASQAARVQDAIAAASLLALVEAHLANERAAHPLPPAVHVAAAEAAVAALDVGSAPLPDGPVLFTARGCRDVAAIQSGFATVTQRSERQYTSVDKLEGFEERHDENGNVVWRVKVSGTLVRTPADPATVTSWSMYELTLSILDKRGGQPRVDRVRFEEIKPVEVE